MNTHVKELQVVLANCYALQLKSQNFHWNVEGRHFSPLHALFEAHYTELAAVVDEVAERIRALGEKIDGSFKGFQSLKTVGDTPQNLDENGMVVDLLAGHRAVLDSLKKAAAAADAVGDAFTSGFLTERIGAHEKAAWMLRSSLKEEMRAQQEPAACYGESCERSVKNCA